MKEIKRTAIKTYFIFVKAGHISKLQIQAPVKNSAKQIVNSTAKIHQSINAPILCHTSGIGAMSSGTAGYALTLRTTSGSTSALVK
jgi:hypothetical protein